MVGFEQATTGLLCDIKALLQRISGKEYDEYESLLITIPEDGGVLELGVGTTRVDFLSGVIISSLGVQTYFQNKLSSHAAEWVKSLYIDVDQTSVFKLDGRSKKTITADAPVQLNYIKTRWIEITCTQTTNLSLVASSNPDTQYKELKNLTSILDPADVYGVRKNIGIGELAARLGSIVNFDRRGDVVLLDDFEAALLKWNVYGTGTGHSEALSTASAKSGAQSVKLVTGDLEDDTALIQKLYYKPFATRLGDEVSFTFSSDIKSIELRNSIYDGDLLHKSRVKYEPQTRDLFIWVDGDTWQSVNTNLYLYSADLLYHTFKFVYDLAKKEYVKVKVDSLVFDVSGIGYDTDISVATPMKQFQVIVTNNAAGNHHVYVDDVVFTQNEPEI